MALPVISRAVPGWSNSLAHADSARTSAQNPLLPVASCAIDFRSLPHRTVPAQLAPILGQHCETHVVAPAAADLHVTAGIAFPGGCKAPRERQRGGGVCGGV